MIEIRGVTFGFDGEQLEPQQAAQRLYKAGFKDAKVLAIMWAILEGESARYLKAWHHNVARDDDGSIIRDDIGRFAVKSTDLGFIQRNVVHSPPKKVTDAESPVFVESLFTANPDLARGDKSAEIAFALYQDRGYQPWYAYSNRGYRRHREAACSAVREYLRVVFGLRRG
jgi:hypothetical protein